MEMLALVNYFVLWDYSINLTMTKETETGDYNDCVTAQITFKGS